MIQTAGAQQIGEDLHAPYLAPASDLRQWRSSATGEPDLKEQADRRLEAEERIAKQTRFPH